MSPELDTPLRDTLAKALPAAVSEHLRSAITDFLVTGSWVSPLESGKYQSTYGVDKRVEETMWAYKFYKRQLGNSLHPTKTQEHALGTFERALADLNQYLNR